jgi:HKD family nuclease
MAELDFILQAVTKATHAKAVRELVQLPDAKQVLISVSFVREAGVAAIEEAIRPVAGRTSFFVGIRNDITSIQAIKRLLALGVRLYAVDTGSRHIIFHPKLYLALSDTEGRGIIGSANVTFSGLHNNIEVSTTTRLNLANESDKEFADAVVTAFVDLLKNHPRHAFEIKDEKQAEALFESGRLVDEDIIQAPTSAGIKMGRRDSLEQMNLTFVIPPRLTKAVSTKVATGSPGSATTAVALPVPTVSLPSNVMRLVWQSKPLTERDLNIPSSGRTHATGSMGWKKGVMEGIDQRHYFRDEIFKNVNWTAHPAPKQSEHASAKFELVIKNVNFGVFDLILAHSTNTKSRTYLQNNFMTQVHWGKALPYVAKRDLLGRTLYLYRKETTPPQFIIEID